MNREMINGYGALLRFVTPLLVALVLFVLNGIKDDVKSLKCDVGILQVSSSNHLEHHRVLEVELSSYMRQINVNTERLSSIERKVR